MNIRAAGRRLVIAWRLMRRERYTLRRALLTARQLVNTDRNYINGSMTCAFRSASTTGGEAPAHETAIERPR